MRSILLNDPWSVVWHPDFHFKFCCVEKIPEHGLRRGWESIIIMEHFLKHQKKSSKSLRFLSEFRIKHHNIEWTKVFLDPNQFCLFISQVVIRLGSIQGKISPNYVLAGLLYMSLSSSFLWDFFQASNSSYFQTLLLNTVLSSSIQQEHCPHFYLVLLFTLGSLTFSSLTDISETLVLAKESN